MHKECLIDYLENRIDLHSLKNQLSNELSEYIQALRKKGSSVPIQLDGDISALRITEDYFKKLYSVFSNNIEDRYLVSYIADAILLSENSVFATEALIDDFEALTVEG